MDSLLSSLKNIYDTIKSLLDNNWKYIAFYSTGSFITSLYIIRSIYKLSGYENPKQFLFAIYLKHQSQKYNSIQSKWRLSKYIPIRPSSTLCVLDQMFYNFIRSGGDDKERAKYIAKPLKQRITEFKTTTCNPSFFDINPTLLSFGNNTNLIKKYIKEIKINGFRSLQINYPGTEQQKDKENIILAFHGGSNVANSPEHYRAFCVLLSKFVNATCYSVGYGLAPEYIMPSQVDHVINAYKYILNKHDKNKINKIFISGHSGGGNIVLLALQKLLKSKNSNDNNERYPDGAIIISANVDRVLEGGTFITNDLRDAAIDNKKFHDMEHLAVGNVDINGIWKNEEEKVDLREPYLSPLYGEVKGLCDLYVHVGLNEGLLSQNEAFIEKCRKNGVDVECEINEWLPHNGPLLCDSVVEARDATVRIAQWIKKRI